MRGCPGIARRSRHPVLGSCLLTVVVRLDRVRVAQGPQALARPAGCEVELVAAQEVLIWTLPGGVQRLGVALLLAAR